ncbi:MAG: glycosyltransferase [Alphaproteobacteria bacterium]|nr:glycosyltransferase [Alphaproteobacteria bacterium]
MSVSNKPATTVAVLVPCYNEAAAIGKVVADFRRLLPRARVYVYDNNSTDDTADAAARAGAIVRTERQQGKGNVVRRMFADIDADVYVLVDGDDTYEAAAAPRMIERLVLDRLDMITGVRHEVAKEAYRRGHRFGNWMLTSLVRWIFGADVGDMLSGYRVLSRRFVKSFPTQATGFGIETEMTVHGLEMLMPLAEMQTDYKERPAGSVSKLNTYRDGFRILFLILTLAKEERPLLFFGLIALVLALTSIGLSIPIVITYLQTGLVPRFPTLIAASAMMLAAFLSFFSGLILDTVTRGRWETKRLAYLQLPPPGST